jgi:hypothetical protein
MASTIKVNNIQNQCGANIANKCGTTITLGASGDTITLACGASQTGFGRTGTVDWDTTAKTASFTAVSGNGYFVNTTSGAITVTTPASPSAGDIFSLADYTRTWQTNNVTLTPNGTDKIGGVNNDATLNTEGQSVTFVFTDSTEGWINVQDSTSAVQGRLITPFICASGGTETTCGDYKIHTFTGPGTLTINNEGTPAGSTTVDYLVVAGGGGGGGENNTTGSGGGGAGGYRESSGAASGCYSRSPLGACVSALPISFTSYPITVGSGGAGGSQGVAEAGADGSNSIFSTIISTGGGGGAGDNGFAGNSGGSGGGGKQGGTAGAGNTPPVSPAQGFNGGSSISGPPASGGGGGGGATAVGANGPPDGGGNGGNGATSSINGSPTTRAGGGGGGVSVPAPAGRGSGGTGGGGNGSSTIPSPGDQPGTANTGGGAGGAGGGTYGVSPGGAGGNGGSGIVIIRYKYQ